MDMKLISNLSMRGGAGTCVRLAAAVAFFAAGSAFAKTPDGMPPSEETVCSALSGAAFGLCNAYCEAQDCDVHPRPSCPVLRRNFEKITGSPVFPCDRGCGDEIVQRGEDCDPPGSECPDGRICNMDCTCPEPFCGDGIVDSGEQCDGSPCTTGLPSTTTACVAPSRSSVASAQRRRLRAWTTCLSLTAWLNRDARSAPPEAPATPSWAAACLN
jgi:hypothetical protein